MSDKKVSSPQKILVIQQKMIGDVLTSTVVCETLKQQYPLASIEYLINSNTLPVVENHPAIDRIIEFKPEHQKNFSSLWRFIQNIKNQHHDLIVDVYGKTQSNLISFFANAPAKVAYHKWYTQFCYTRTVKRKNTALTNASKAIENRLRLVVPEEELLQNIRAPKIYLTDKELQSAKQLLDKNGLTGKRLVMISVLGSGPKKSLPAAYMAQIIDHIVEHNADVHILYNYMPNQLSAVQEIHALTHSDSQKVTHLDVYGSDLRSFLALLSCCQAIIGNEGGAINMAKALEIPTFTVFSPWIEKHEWNMFENDSTHQSVHLSDFQPEMYAGIAAKSLKNKAEQLYQLMTPTLYSVKLESYYQVNQHFSVVSI